MKSRINFLDNLRTFLIFLVVVLHSGLVYEAVLENTWIVVDPVKNNSIGLIRMYLDLFVMFCIFFISGYFVPRSLNNKSSWGYLKSKFKRILLPWVIAVFTLIPAYKAIFLYSRGLPQEEWFSYFHFFERAGTDLYFFSNNPTQNWLWFLPVLFLFQVLYLGLKKLNLLSFNISLKAGAALTFIIGVAYSMAISAIGLKGWTHSALFDFQNERLLVYFMSFLLGSLCYKLKVFETGKKNVKMYIVSNVVLAVVMTVFTLVAINLFYNIIEPGRNYYYVSEWVDKLVYYISALALMLSFLHILIYTFRYSFNKINVVMSELNRNSYSVYIIHTIVIGVVAMTLINVPIPAFSKFIIVTLVSFTLSNMLIYTYRKSIQKTINMKTIVTAIAAILITGVAFQGKSVNPEEKQTQVIRTEQNSTLPSMGLHEAVVAGNVVVVKQHINAGSDLNVKEQSGGSSPLSTAALFGKTEIAKLLIEAGADINSKNNDGSTPLHTAAFFCRTEIVQSLLDNGADATIRNNSGATAMESVAAPFEAVKGIYDYFSNSLAPLGLELDYEMLKNTRPEIAEMLK